MKTIGVSETGKMIYAAPPEEIIVPEERFRWIFEKTAMEELKASVKDKGQLLPGICRQEEDGKIVLIAGERRLRACSDLDIPYEFFITEETDPLRIRSIELEENLVRENLDFKEKAAAVDEFHALQQGLNPPSPGRVTGGQTLEDTAKTLRKSPTTVREELELAKFMELDEVKNAKSRTEARKIIKRIKEDYARSKALKEAEKLREEEEGILPEELAEREQEREQEEDEPTDSPQKGKKELLRLINFFSPKVLEGRMEDRLNEFPDEHFDLVLFDPPWGQNLSEVERETGTKTKFDDSPEIFLSNLENWLSLLYQKMAVDSHLYMFFGIKDHAFVYDLLEKVGFQVNWMPIIWAKLGAHRTRNPKIWPGRSYEPIAFARKGKKDLVWLGAPDFAQTPAPTAAMKGSHMAGKNPDIYLNLIKRSAFPGDKVLDPMAGTGMAGVACEVFRPTHQLDWTLIEEKEEFVSLSIANLVKGYSNIVFRGAAEKEEPLLEFWYCSECKSSGSASELVEKEGRTVRDCCPNCGEISLPLEKELPKDFREIPLGEEGKEMWMLFWKLFPEQQDEMLEWKKLH